MKSKFEIIATCNLTNVKQLVISKNDANEIVIAKRMVIEDEGVTKYYYEKGAIVIPMEEFKNLLNDINLN